MTNSKIQSLWIGPSLSPIEQMSVQSYLDNGHNFDLYCYEDVSNIPVGATVRDANEIAPKDRLFKDSHNSWAAFSDWFRYQLLYKNGGWWSDLDVICLRPFDFESEYCFATERNIYSSTGNNTVTSCIIKAPAEANVLAGIIGQINENIKPNVLWGSFGPTLLHRHIHGSQYGAFKQSPETFCPINWNEIDQFFDENFLLETDSYTIHLWNEIWRRQKIDKFQKFHPRSMIEYYKRKHKPIVGTIERE
ncbi:MAG: glycosyltransferase [Sphingobacterium sp.]